MSTIIMDNGHVDGEYVNGALQGVLWIVTRLSEYVDSKAFYSLKGSLISGK